jgi:hypothetical protein
LTNRRRCQSIVRRQADLSNELREAMIVRLTFLGKKTQRKWSPTLFATDRDTYVVQGWRVPGHETSVEIPMGLLEYLEADTRLAAVLHSTGHGSYVVSGAAVHDAEALAQMDIPDHETCIEVGKVREGDVNDTAARPSV